MLDEATLKIVRRTRHAVILEAANTACAPIEIRGKARGQVEILGKLAGVIRRA